MGKGDGERGRSGVSGFWLALASIAFAFPITAVTVTSIRGAEAVVALAIEWGAIAIINIGYSRFPGGDRPQAEVPQRRAGPAVAALSAPDQRELLGRLPLGVQVKVDQIRRKAEVLLEHQGRFPLGSKDVYVLQRTRAEYLPATLNAYFALSGDDRPVAADGRTPLHALSDQLDLLDTKLDEIADDLQRDNYGRLLANERFLEEHFGRSADPVPAGWPAPPAHA